MFINIFKSITLFSFIVSALYTIFYNRNIRPGIIVMENDKQITDGKSIDVYIGRDRSCDIVTKKTSASRFTMAVRSVMKPAEEYFSIIRFKDKHHYKTIDASIETDGRAFSITIADNHCPQSAGLIPFAFTISFLLLQVVSAKGLLKHTVVIINILLCLFNVVSFLLKSFCAPVITENTFSILLSLHTTVNTYNPTDLSRPGQTKRAFIAIFLYLFFFTAGKIFFKHSFCFSDRLAEHAGENSIPRYTAIVLMILLIGVNIIFAPNTAGAKNWIYIGGISIQLGEAIKPLLAYITITPPGVTFKSPKNIFIVLFSGTLVFIYAYVIRDIGLLLQLGVIFGVACIIQTDRIKDSFILISAALCACKVIIRFSATANRRWTSWIGEMSLADAFTGGGIVGNSKTTAYQQVKAFIAYKNAGWFGNLSLNPLEGVTAANSDLVSAFLCSIYGNLIVFFLLALYFVLLCNTLCSLKEKYRFSRIFSVLSACLIASAVVLNIGGSFAIIPLTGVVLPGVSFGLSSCLYGIFFGAMASHSLSVHKRRAIFAQKTNPTVIPETIKRLTNFVPPVLVYFLNPRRIIRDIKRKINIKKGV